MWNRIAVLLFVLACTAGCTTVSDTPATAPSTTVVTSTVDTSATTTVTTPETTTTLDRITEIEAIFLDLERRRLQAILDQDEEAYRAVFANEYYEEESMVVFESVEVMDPNSATVTVLEVLVDRPNCVAARVRSDQTGVSASGGVADDDWVVELSDGHWGFSWAGEGWQCDPPHPLSP